MIPPALRATSLFKGGSGERCSPLRWDCLSCNALPCETRVGESFSFFASFFLFSKEKKKGIIALQTPKNSIDRLHRQQAKKPALQVPERATMAFASPGGQRGKRAIPPDGFTVFSLGRCCRKCKGIIGRTVFAPTVSSELPVLFGAGRWEHRPLRWVFRNGEIIAYRKTIIPRRGEQAACPP